MAIDCSFKDANEIIRDRILFGMTSGKTREKLINEGEKLALDKAIQICQNVQYAQEQLPTMSQSGALSMTSADSPVPVHAINNSSGKCHRNPSRRPSRQ